MVVSGGVSPRREGRGPATVLALTALLIGCGRLGFETVRAASKDGGLAAPDAGGVTSAGDAPAAAAGDAPSGPDAGSPLGFDGATAERTQPEDVPAAAASDAAADLPSDPARRLGDGPLAAEAAEAAEAADPATAAPTTLTVADFSRVPGLSTSGVAQVVGSALRLVDGERNTAGSAYLKPAFRLTSTARFQVAFSFQISGAGQLADGMTFNWQNDGKGPGELGSPGGGLGYGGVSPSVAVEFDIAYNDGDPVENHVAVLRDGDTVAHLAVAIPPFALASGQPLHAWIDYDEATQALDVYVAPSASRPATPLLSHRIDLAAIIGDRAYVGWTAGTGVKTSTADILSMSLAYQP